MEFIISCFRKMGSDLTLIIGGKDLSAPTSPKTIMGITSHPSFNSTTKVNNLALILLAAAQNDTDILTPILFNNYASLSFLQKATVVGYGKTSKHAEAYSYSLKFTTVSIIANKNCELLYTLYPYKINEDVLCAMSMLSGPCEGDYGGPLIKDGALIGIVSVGKIWCGIYPVIYVRVDKYDSWIRSIVGN